MMQMAKTTATSKVSIIPESLKVLSLRVATLHVNEGLPCPQIGAQCQLDARGRCLGQHDDFRCFRGPASERVVSKSFTAFLLGWARRCQSHAVLIIIIVLRSDRDGEKPSSRSMGYPHFHIEQRVLVSGGAGFLGSYLCDWLLDADRHVLCVGNFFTGTRRKITRTSSYCGMTAPIGCLSRSIGFSASPVLSPIRYFAHPPVVADEQLVIEPRAWEYLPRQEAILMKHHIRSQCTRTLTADFFSHPAHHRDRSPLAN